MVTTCFSCCHVSITEASSQSPDVYLCPLGFVLKPEATELCLKHKSEPLLCLIPPFLPRVIAKVADGLHSHRAQAPTGPAQQLLSHPGIPALTQLLPESCETCLKDSSLPAVHPEHLHSSLLPLLLIANWNSHPSAPFFTAPITNGHTTHILSAYFFIVCLPPRRTEIRLFT